MVAHRNPLTCLRSVMAAATLLVLAAPARGDTLDGRLPLAVEPPVSPRARPFPLEEVRLLPGPFHHAMELDRAYLLRLEPERLLAGFRREAGLPPEAEMYGGWERMGVAGHTLGHTLSASSLLFASTGDERLRARVQSIVAELARCQEAGGTGYVAAIPEGQRVFAEVARGEIRTRAFELNGVWVPWYTLHKLLAGLLDAHRHAASERALAVARKLADWAEAITLGLTDELFQRLLACEHGGMNEVLAELYGRTGERRYLDLSLRFHHRAVLGPLARGEDCLPGLHANTQFPKVIGAARRYELTGDATDRAVAEFFWDRVVHHHSYVTGGNSDHEHFGPPDRLNDRLSANTTESCNTYNMLKLTRHLFAWHAAAMHADYYERALYNHVLASQNPRDGMTCYYVPLASGLEKTYSTPFDSFTCCVGTGMESHAKYSDSIYWRYGDGLLVNLFIPSELRWEEKGLALRQETRYPEEDVTRFSVSCAAPIELTLHVRSPGWARSGLEIELNGEKLPVPAAPGTYASLRRTWRDGDRVRVRIPMGLRLEAMPDNPRRAAVLYGPVVLAGDLSGAQAGAADLPDLGALWVPVLVTEERSLEEWLRPVPEEPLTFRTAGAGRPAEVTLIPFYKMHGRPYAVYWDFSSDEEWREREARRRAEEKRLRELAVRTVDVVRIGETEPERAHELEGERTSTGTFGGRRWRHATGGGWFSFAMEVQGNEPLDLVCTYWGSDAGGRVFDILVDGTRIATQELERNAPGRFFDAIYPVPEDLTRGKKKVTVRFQAHPGRWAGGLFGCRLVRR